MKKYKIYLETTLFNYYFDSERPAHAETVMLFNDIAAGKYEAYTSDAVIGELKRTPTAKKDMMLDLVEKYKINMLAVDDDTRELADSYIEQNMIPAKYKTDAVHIAVSVVNKLDYIISMNFQHIVNAKTRRMTDAVNTLSGYFPINIISPMEPIL